MRLVDLKTQALRYLALGEAEKALLVYRGILLQVPADLDSRMRVGDVLAQIGQHHLACRVYAAVAWCDLQAGRPLHALVCSQALSDLRQSAESIHESLAELYGAGSLRLRVPLFLDEEAEGEEASGSSESSPRSAMAELQADEVAEELHPIDHRGASRFAIGPIGEIAASDRQRTEPDTRALGVVAEPRLPRDGGTSYANHLLSARPDGGSAELGTAPSLIAGPDTEVSEGGMLGMPLERAAEAAAEVAADVRSFTAFLSSFAPVPLFSALRGEAFVRVTHAARIRRVGPRELLVKEGVQNAAALFIASGSAQIFRERADKRQVLGVLGEGAVLGDLGLVAVRAAAVSVETTEPTDLVEIPIRALRTLVAEDPAASRALLHYARERLIGVLLLNSPLFKPLRLSQRRALLRRFQAHHVAADQVLLREGERMEGLCLVLQGTVELLHGLEPFEEVAGHLYPGMVCGEPALLRPVAAPWTLRATTAATVLFLPRESFERASQGSPEARAYLFGLPVSLLRELSGPGRDVLPRVGAPLSLSPEGDSEDFLDTGEGLFGV